MALAKPPRPSTSGDVSPAGRVGPRKAASEPGVVAAAFPVLSSVQPRHSTSPCTPTLGSPRSGPWHKYWGWGAGDPREHNEEARGEADGLGDSPLPPPRAPPAPDFSTLSCSCHQGGHPEDHQVNVPRESANRQVSVTSVTSHLQRVSTACVAAANRGHSSLVAPRARDSAGPWDRRVPGLRPTPRSFGQDAGAAAEVPGPVHGPPADPPGRLEAEGQGRGPPGSPARGPAAGKGLRDRPLRGGRCFKEVEIAKGQPRDHRSAVGPGWGDCPAPWGPPRPPLSLSPHPSTVSLEAGGRGCVTPHVSAGR